jgi:hypothetical protein
MGDLFLNPAQMRFADKFKKEFPSSAVHPVQQIPLTASAQPGLRTALPGRQAISGDPAPITIIAKHVRLASVVGRCMPPCCVCGGDAAFGFRDQIGKLETRKYYAACGAHREDVARYWGMRG